MIGSLIKKIVGSKNERELKRIRPLVYQISQMEAKVSPLSDDQLRAKTSEFKERIERGESVDEILPEAFAVVREAGRRTLGERHFDVQLIGGIILHEGKIGDGHRRGKDPGRNSPSLPECPHRAGRSYRDGE